MKLKLQNFIPYISVFVFALLSWFFLVVRNGDVLFMQQLRSLFVDTPDFFQQYIVKPAGFLQWAGCYFTQMFYHPALGSTVPLVMWTMIFFLLKKGLHISNTLSPLLIIPLLCLLVSEIDLGYWIYNNSNAGYCFSSTIGLLATAVFVWLFSIIPAKSAKVGLGVRCGISLLIAALFPLFGIYSLVALVVIAITLAFERNWTICALNILLAIATPLLFKQLVYTEEVGNMFTAGLPFFQMRSVTSPSLSNPFIYAIISLVVLAILPKIPTKQKKEKFSLIASVILMIAVIGGSVWILKSANYDDENYRAECKAYRAMDEQRWEDVLASIREVKGPLTRQLIIFKNIALMNTHKIGENMFDYDNKGKVPATRDSLQVSMSNTASPIIYLHHGMINFAYRYCMEIQVEFGFNIACLKIMAISAIFNGEGKLAEKYLNMLSHTMYYKEWAEHYRPLARNPKLIGKYPELANINELHSQIGEGTADDDGICENHIASYFANAQNEGSKYFQEMTLVYSIVVKDIETFWSRYTKYIELHKGEKVPEVYQQVAHFYAVNKPEMVPISENFSLQIDPDIVERYNLFYQRIIELVNYMMAESDIASMTKKEYGNTFWWAYFYNQNAMCY